MYKLYMKIEILKFFLLFFSFLFLFIKNRSIALKFNILDNPDNIRKFHTIPTPLTGGLFLILSLSVENFLSNNYASISFVKIFYFHGLLTSAFIIGFLDDSKSLLPITRLILLSVMLFVFIKLIPELKIQNIKFRDIEYSIFLKEYSIIVTIFFILLLVNANNMIDGMNGIAVYFFIFVLFYFAIKGLIPFFNIIIFTLILLFFLNLFNKLFLGSSGNMIMSFYISYLTITNYNSSTSLFCDEIFILFILPGVDMLRLFIKRIYKKKNPFKGDRNHFHQILESKYGNNKALLIWIIFCTYPIILFSYLDFFLTLTIFFSSYIFLIYYLKPIKSLK